MFAVEKGGDDVDGIREGGEGVVRAIMVSVRSIIDRRSSAPEKRNRHTQEVGLC